VALGVFARSPAETVLAAVGLAGLFALVFAAWTDDAPRWSYPLAAVLCVLGALIAASTNFTGWFIFGIGCVVVVGRPQAPYLLTALGWGVGAVTLVALQVRQEPDIETLIWNSIGVVGVLLLGITRRQAALRRQQQGELVDRSRQLQQRSLELIEQTERTRAETARAAALEERTRIARDLHDLLAHALGGLIVQLDAAEAVLGAGGDRDQVAARLRSSRQLAVEGLRDARAAVRELHSARQPEVANVADAVAAVINGPVGMQLGLSLDVVGEPYPIPYPVAQAFAAVAREATTNINKHAPGGRTAASLIFEDRSVRLEVINEITDQHDAMAELAQSGGGFGLDGLQRRMTEVGCAFRAGAEGGRWVVSAAWQRADTEEERA
jgi:signal transduction histidine kinase